MEHVTHTALTPIYSTSTMLGQDERPSQLRLPEAITRASSKQTYYTIRLFADRDRVIDAYRAYAYFRWVDDLLDEGNSPLEERLAFIERQQALMTPNYHAHWLDTLTPEETMLVNLVNNHPERNNGLHAYLNNMMAVMEFDARRRGQLISQQELDNYSLNLSTAVTEALHYFIGHDRYSPCGEARYQAVYGAHITHMLRDTIEDVEAGYYNISREYVEASGLDPHDVQNDLYRDWVRSRVQQARACFKAGREHITQVESMRCRMAGQAYTTRFEIVLDAIEKDGYRLRRDYPERKNFKAAMRLIRSAVVGSFKQ